MNTNTYKQYYIILITFATPKFIAMSFKKASKITAPLITVVIPTYNRQDLIGKTLDSVIAQTYGNWECIVVDDLSTDDTAKIVQNYIDIEPRIRFIPMPTKGNANVSRNKGITLAKGDYIAMLDSDDTWLEHHLESRLHCIRATEADGVYGGHILKTTTTSVTKYSRAQKKEESNFYFITFSQVPKTTPSLFFNTTAIKSVMWDEKLVRHQDFDFLIRFLQKHIIKVDTNITVIVNVDENRNSLINAKGNNHNVYLNGCIQYFNKYKKNFYSLPFETFLYLFSFFKLVLIKKNWKYKKYYFYELIKLIINPLRLFSIINSFIKHIAFTRNTQNI